MNSKILTLFAVIAIALASCKGNNDIVPYGKPANLNIVNADTAALNVYQNGARINQLSSLGPGSQSGYISVPFGSKMYEVKKDGATSYLINNFTLKLDTTAFYTLFIAGETADKLFLASDTITLQASATMAIIRVVNASPTSTNFDISVGNLTFKAQAFKAITGFNYVAPGTTVAVTIYQAGTATVLYSNTVTLQIGGAYTLFTKGVPGGTGQNKLSVILTSN